MIKQALPALVVAFIIFIIGMGSASADTTLTYVDQASGRGSVRIAIHDRQIRVEDLRGQRFNALYNAKSAKLTLLDRAQKTYTVFDRDAPQQIQQFVQTISGFQHSLSELFTGAAPPTNRLRIESTPRTASRGERSCRVLDARMNGRLSAEICVAPAKALHISATDAATLQALGKTVERLSASFKPYLVLGGNTNFIAQGKVPVRLTHAEQGRTYADILKTISSRQLSSALFAVPKNYRERSLTAEIYDLARGG
jgi:hypothetical protein